MTGSVLRILIADNHYIIGLEAQRIISDAHPCVVTICRRDELSQAMTDSYDFVFVDAAPTAHEQAQQAEIVKTMKAGLVFLHTGQLSYEQQSKIKPLAAFEKPFNEDEIGDFIRSLT